MEDAVSKMSLRELTPRIDAHLKRMEADPEINQTPSYFSQRTGKEEQGSSLFYHASAYYRSGPKLSITYVTCQGSSKLSKADAAKYLAWLDAGNNGKHWQAS